MKYREVFITEGTDPFYSVIQNQKAVKDGQNNLHKIRKLINQLRPKRRDILLKNRKYNEIGNKTTNPMKSGIFLENI